MKNCANYCIMLKQVNQNETGNVEKAQNWHEIKRCDN